jgi:hypothetical protein
MKYRLSGRELFLLCGTSAIGYTAMMNVFASAEFGRQELASALIVASSTFVIWLTLREARRRDSRPVV